MGFTLGAFASLKVLFFVIGFYSRIIHVVKVYFWVFLLDYFYSVFYASPKSSEPRFGLELCVKRKEPGIANYAVVEASLVLGPKHSCEWSLHGLGFDQVFLMGRQFDFFSLVSRLTNKVVNQVGLEDLMVLQSFFEVFVLSHFVQN